MEIWNVFLNACKLVYFISRVPVLQKLWNFCCKLFLTCMSSGKKIEDQIMHRFVVIDFSFIIRRSLCKFFKLFRNQILMKIVGGYTSSIWMLRKIGNLLLDTFQIGFSIYAISSLAALPFLYRIFYLAKWHETFIVVLW